MLDSMFGVRWQFICIYL